MAQQIVRMADLVNAVNRPRTLTLRPGAGIQQARFRGTLPGLPGVRGPVRTTPPMSDDDDARLDRIEAMLAVMTAGAGAGPRMQDADLNAGITSSARSGSVEYGGNVRFDGSTQPDSTPSGTSFSISMSGDNLLRSQNQNLQRIGCYIQPVAGSGGAWANTPENALVTLRVNGIPQVQCFREPLAEFLTNALGDKRFVLVNRRLPGQTVNVDLLVEVIEPFTAAAPGDSSRIMFWAEASGY